MRKSATHSSLVLRFSRSGDTSRTGHITPIRLIVSTARGLLQRSDGLFLSHLKMVAKGANTTMSKKLSTEEILRLNQKRINKVLQQNGVNPNTVPPLEGTCEERSKKRTQEVFANNQKRIDKMMRKYR